MTLSKVLLSFSAPSCRMARVGWKLGLVVVAAALSVVVGPSEARLLLGECMEAIGWTYHSGPPRARLCSADTPGLRGLDGHKLHVACTAPDTVDRRATASGSWSSTSLPHCSATNRVLLLTPVQALRHTSSAAAAAASAKPQEQSARTWHGRTSSVQATSCAEGSMPTTGERCH